MNQISDLQIAILGAGKMGSAFLQGMLAAPDFCAKQFCAICRSESSASAVRERCGVEALEGWPQDRAFDIILLGVKPAQIRQAVMPLRQLAQAPLVISLVTGWSIEDLRTALGSPAEVVRAMPNTPASIGRGMIPYCYSPDFPKDKKWVVEKILEAGGSTAEIEESQMDAVTGVSGSGPAYFFLFIEALAEAGVREGLPRPLAQQLALETAAGSAALLQQTGKHAALAREDVTSPGGTTIAALSQLERHGVRTALFDAVHAAATRSKELGS